MDQSLIDPPIDRKIDSAATSDIELEGKGLRFVHFHLIDGLAALLDVNPVVIERIQSDLKILNVVRTYVLQLNLDCLRSYPNVPGC